MWQARSKMARQWKLPGLDVHSFQSWRVQLLLSTYYLVGTCGGASTYTVGGVDTVVLRSCTRRYQLMLTSPPVLLLHTRYPTCKKGGRAEKGAERESGRSVIEKKKKSLGHRPTATLSGLVLDSSGLASNLSGAERGVASPGKHSLIRYSTVREVCVSTCTCDVLGTHTCSL